MQTLDARLRGLILRGLSIFLLAAALASCNGSDGDGPDIPGTNSAPTSDAGQDQTVFESTTVNLTGSGSDPNPTDTLTYEWTQTAGPAVTINNATAASADFTAPNAAAGSPAMLTFQLRVSDGTLSTDDTVEVRVEEDEPPVANAGPNRTVVENIQVTLDGTASSDPNTIGPPLTYSWSQVGGVAVTLTGADTAQPTFMSPDVAPASTEVLMFELVVSDGVSNDMATATITVQEGQAMVTISGNVFYEFVPPSLSGTNCTGLDFANTQTRPIRGATVQLLDAGNGNVLGAATLTDTGAYSFTNIPSNIQVTLRVLAELVQTGTPSWSFEVRDNIDTSGSPPPFESRPLYGVERTFDTGSVDKTEDMTAQTGWDGASYSSARAAAPFAILDVMYSGLQLVLSVDGNVILEPMDAFWNANNTLVTSGTTDPNNGEIFPFYTSDPEPDGNRNPSLFLTGDPTTDTDEFDDHVIAHEWGHYFEDVLSRSDSRGGSHILGQSLDARLAWGEGWAHAIGSIALGDPQSCDTRAFGNPSSSFGWSNESDGFGVQGWFNEISVATFVYDLWDTADDGTDNMSLGFAPIYNTMVGPQTSTPAFTTMFSFASELRPMLAAAEQTFLDSQLARENTVNGAALDIWATNETNDANSGRDVLPMYTDHTADGNAINICTNNDFDNGGTRTGNKLAEKRYLRLTIPTTGFYDVLMQTTTATPPTADPNDLDQSDPDMLIYLAGVLVAAGTGVVDNQEAFETQNILNAGQTYVADVSDFRFADEDNTPATYPDQICFDVSFTATP